MPIRWAFLKRVLAGAIFGLYVAHLLYFLNPQVDITPSRLLGITLVYSAIGGVLFGTALWLLRVGRVKLFGRTAEPGEFKAHGFGFVVLAAFIATATYWIHLMVLRDFLPIGAVHILSKATNVITATAFLLLILWFFERNADRRMSRAIFGTGVLVIAVSSFFLYERRESYHAEKRTVVVANVGTVAGKRPLLFVAIRNLPYDWILTMSGEGLLPNFDRAAKSAYFTRVEPFRTTTWTALWASLATGKLPYQHGVTGEYSYRTPFSSDRFLLLPRGVGFELWGLPVKRISAQLPSGDALPIWTAFERLSLRAEVIAWPASAPPALPRAPMRGVAAVAQRFNGTGPARDRILGALARDLQALAVARQDDFDLRFVGLDGFSAAQRALHVFTNDLPPRSSMKGAALRAYAQQLDAMVGAILRANPDRLVVICSPSGVVPPAIPATAWSVVAQFVRNDDPGADDGFLLISGPGVVHKTSPESASIVDIVPTILFAADLPIGRDMDGRVLTDAFDDDFLRRTKISAIQTYEAEHLVVRRSGA